MRRRIITLLALGLLAPTFAAQAQTASYQCPTGYKLIGRVCLSQDQQRAICLYPDKVGATPRHGTTQDANPAACPRHPPQ
jgi:hypothetical protein